MLQSCPRILIAGSNSGCGKTTVTCAILQALVNRGKKIAAFKCGPDYIDPMFHSRIIGAKSSNLDLFFFLEQTASYLLAKNSRNCDLSVIEGVMGFYDGIGLTTTKASSYEISQKTKSPTILIVNAKGASFSVLAQIQGFLDFMPDHLIRGVILNQCSARTYSMLSQEIAKRFAGKVKPLGYLPRMSNCSLESRHLGLVTADEVVNLKEKLQLLAEQAEQSIDLDLLLEVAEQAAPLKYEEQAVEKRETVRIAVAKDKAFCFYYEDNLRLLQDMGAELLEFSPLNDDKLPESIHGLYLGGGYPELYAKQLSANVSMRNSVKQALEKGLPCIAECGGFMYLTEKIGEEAMVAFLKGRSFDTGKLQRFGYITLTAKVDNLLCEAGESICAHEFHHWDSEETGSGFIAQKSNQAWWEAVHVSPRLYAGYPHFHFYSNLKFAQNYYQACLEEKHRDGQRI